MPYCPPVTEIFDNKLFAPPILVNPANQAATFKLDELRRSLEETQASIQQINDRLDRASSKRRVAPVS